MQLAKQSLSIFVSFSLFLNQCLYAADLPIEVDTTAAAKHQATLDKAPNGVQIVNIVNPNSKGMSHNKFKEYNVNPSGLILNNSKAVVNTQLAGYISFNPNLTNNASVILNEVTGTNKSLLKGYSEVAGVKADVIVANPNGITVNGGGFINTNKATLTTGRPSFLNGFVNGFDITQGQILIEGDGLNTTNINKVELYSKALQVNAKFYANNLKVATGDNFVDLNGNVTSKETLGSGVSIDSSLLGGIYANRIELISSNKGVGVNLPPEVFAQDSLSLSADGDIFLSKTIANNTIDITSINGDINNTSTLSTDSLTLNAKNSLTNSGSIESNNVTIDTNSLINTNNMYTQNDITLNTQTLTNSGLIQTDNNFNLVTNTLTNNVNSTISAANESNITTIQLVNNGTLVSKFLNIDATTVNNTSTLSSTDNLILNATESLTNSGSIKGNNITVDTKSIVNTDKIYAANDIRVTSNSVENRGYFNSDLDFTFNVNTLDNYATLFSGNDMNLYVKDTLFNHEFSNILAINNLNIGKDTQKTNLIKNEKANIETIDGDITVYANELQNITDTPLKTETLVSSKNYDSGNLPNGYEAFVRYDLAKLNEDAKPFGLHIIESQFKIGGDLGEWGWKYTAISNIGNETRRIATLTTNDETIDTIPNPATILSAGKMNLYVNKTKNYLSQIASNDTLNIVGNSLNNSGETLYRKNTLTGSYEYVSGGGGLFHSTHYSWASLPSSTTYQTIGEKYSTISSGKDITGGLASVNNIDIKSNQAPFGSTGSTLKLDETLDSVKIDPTTNPIEIRLPQSKYGLFTLSNNPEYLVEKNPAFTSYNTFISSDYMLGKLNYKPENTIKRLGDGLYENKLIRDSIFAQSGKRYLASNITSDAEQFTYLMDNALALQKDLQLTPGISLSKEQIANLTKDIVWMEEKVVSGQTVLAPVVYLTNIDNKNASLILANGDIKLNTTNLVNAGTIQSGNNLIVNAQGDILNAGGNLLASNDLNLNATNITNLSSTMQGNSVNITSDKFTSDVATKDIIRNLDNGVEKNTLVSQSSNIISNTNVNIQTKEDINLIGTNVKAKEDVNLTSQNGNVNIASKETSNSFNNKTKTGYLKQSKTQQLSSNVEANNVNVNGNNITVQASNITANENLNLIAKENVIIQEATNQNYLDLKHELKGGFFGGKLKLAQTKDTKTIVSSILKANNVNITSKDTKLIASQIIANEAQITADILTLMSKKDLDYESYLRDSSGFITKTLTSKGHVKENVVEAIIKTNKLVLNNKDITNQLRADTLVKTLSSQYDLNIEQIKLIKQIATSKEWDVSTTSLTGVGQLIVAAIVAVCTAGAGLAVVGAAGTATAGTTAAAIQAAVVQSVVTGVTTQLVTSAITGNSFKLDSKSLVLGAISAGVMSYASSMIDSSLGLQNVKVADMSTAQQIQKGVANTVVKSGVNSALYGTSFEDSLKTGLVTDISNVGFRLVGDTSMFKAYADGSLEKVALHGAVGATTAALLGENAKVGAVAAGMNELASPILDGLDNERQIALSGLIGGLSAGAVGGDSQISMGQTIAQSGTKYNRQLHAKEKALIENNAEAYSKEKGISLTQAKKELYSILMYYNDKEYQNNVFLGLSDEQKQAGLIPVIGDKVQLDPAEMFKTLNALALQSKDKTIGGFYKGDELYTQPILSSTQEQFNNSSVDFKTPDGMVDPAYFIPFGKVGTTVVKATETIGSKSISVVAQKTGQLYDDVTLGVIGQANKIAPSLTSKYLANPTAVTNNANDFVSSYLPGVPDMTRAGLSGYVLDKGFNYESTLDDINKGVELGKTLFNKAMDNSNDE